MYIMINIHVVSSIIKLLHCSVLFFDGCVPESDGRVPVDCDGCVLVYMMFILIAV